jgi:zinc transporter ZupT
MSSAQTNQFMKKILLVLSAIIIFLGVGFFMWNNVGSVPDFMHPTMKYAIWAFAIGALVTISLPLGAMSGLAFKPGPKMTAIFTAFGAGALLAALSVELIAPTVEEIVGHINSPTGMEHGKKHAFFTMGALIIGCIGGGILFYTLDELINSKGGVIRKLTSSFKLSKRKKADSHEEEIVYEEHKDGAHKTEEHSGGGMAIWLGLLIDGIPESFVIGAGFLTLLSVKLGAGVEPAFTEVLPYTLIAGLFLSNFPEALSASMGMKKSGMSTGKIMGMWMSLVLIIGVGALVGYYIGSSIPHEIEIAIEGLAAGAMLTMIAQTMIPEAVHLGGAKVVGLSTLIGYLSAVAFKLLE